MKIIILLKMKTVLRIKKFITNLLREIHYKKMVGRKFRS